MGTEIRTYTQLQIALRKPGSKHEIWDIFLLFYLLCCLGSSLLDILKNVYDEKLPCVQIKKDAMEVQKNFFSSFLSGFLVFFPIISCKVLQWET